jgi:hypothetical protein
MRFTLSFSEFFYEPLWHLVLGSWHGILACSSQCKVPVYSQHLISVNSISLTHLRRSMVWSSLRPVSWFIFYMRIQMCIDMQTWLSNVVSSHRMIYEGDSFDVGGSYYINGSSICICPTANSPSQSVSHHCKTFHCSSEDCSLHSFLMTLISPDFNWPSPWKKKNGVSTCTSGVIAQLH